jgi:hypothetical protein
MGDPTRLPTHEVGCTPRIGIEARGLLLGRQVGPVKLARTLRQSVAAKPKRHLFAFRAILVGSWAASLFTLWALDSAVGAIAVMGGGFLLLILLRLTVWR